MIRFRSFRNSIINRIKVILVLLIILALIAIGINIASAQSTECTDWGKNDPWTKLVLNYEFTAYNVNENDPISDLSELTIGILHEQKKISIEMDISIPKRYPLLLGGEISFKYSPYNVNKRWFMFIGGAYRNGQRVLDNYPWGRGEVITGMEYKSPSTRHFGQLEGDIRLGWDLISKGFYPSVRVQFILFKTQYNESKQRK